MWKPSWLRRPDKAQVTPVASQSDLWWVKVILNVGRPVVAVIVLVMCAPGEHYLARMAGWSHWLAWGMPATLTAYAGIAAVVATKRPKKSPGKVTAVAGAIISVLLAMGAQPISHLYERGLVTGHQTLLTIIVSCIPALVFGHLLHMAAAPVVQPDTQDKGDVVGSLREAGYASWNRRSQVAEDSAPQDSAPQDSEPGLDAFEYRAGDEELSGMDADLSALRDNSRTTIADAFDVPRDMIDPSPEYDRARQEMYEMPGSMPVTNADRLRQDALERINRPRPEPELWTAPVGTPTPDTAEVPPPWQGHRADLVLVDDVPVSAGDMPTEDTEAEGDNYPGPPRGQEDMSHPVPLSPVPQINGTRTSVTGRVRDILTANPDMTDNQIKDKFTGEDIRPNTLTKAIKRVRAGQ